MSSRAPASAVAYFATNAISYTIALSTALTSQHFWLRVLAWTYALLITLALFTIATLNASKDKGST